MVYTKEIVQPQGRIWDCHPSTSASGLMTVIVNKKHRKNDSTRPRFTAVAFSSKGDEIGAVDERGNVYVFHVLVNHYSLLRRAKSHGSHARLTYSPRSVHEFSTSLSSYDGGAVLCLNSDSKETVATLKTHRSPVVAISFHESSALMATASADKVVLWNTNNWTQVKSLRKAGGIVDVAFTPVDDMLLVAFKDGRVLGYGAHTYELEFHLESPLPPDSDPVTNRDIHRVASQQIAVNCIQASSNARFLFVGCDGGLIMIWDLVDQVLIRMVEMPESVGRIVKGVFVSDIPGIVDPTHSLKVCIALLGTDGVVRVVSIDREDASEDGCRVVFQIEAGTQTAIVDFAIDHEERYLVASVSDGTLALHDLHKAVEYYLRKLESPSAEFSSAFQGAHMKLKSFNGFVTPQVSEQDRRAAQENDKVFHADGSSKSPGMHSQHDRDNSNRHRAEQHQGTWNYDSDTGPQDDDKSSRSVTASDELKLAHHQSSETALEDQRQNESNFNNTANRHRFDNTTIKSVPTSQRNQDESQRTPGYRNSQTNHGSFSTTRKSTTTSTSRNDAMPSISSLLRGTTSEEILLDRHRIEAIVNEHGSFPERYRFMIWRFLLKLPENEIAFSTLTAKGIHPVWENLESKYPMKDRRMSTKLQTILSALSFWSPVFSEVSYLPALVMPFVSCFRSNPLVAFEMTVVLIFNWCQNWFESFPHPPIPLLSAIEASIEHVDPDLHSHLVECDISSQTYAWIILRSLFTEVLERHEWLQLWDNLIARQDKPYLLSVAVVAYLCYFRSSLLLLKRKTDFEHFCRFQNALSMSRFIKFILRIERMLPENIKWKLAHAEAATISDTAEQLTHGSIKSINRNHTALSTGIPFTHLPIQGPYPVFTKYPKFVVDFRAQERMRIEAEEAELKEKVNLVATIKERTEQLEREEQEWRLYQERLLQEEEQRSNEDQLSFERRHEAKMTALAKQRTQKLEQLAKLELAAKERLALQKRMREAESKRLTQELERQKKQHDSQLEAQREDEALKKLEFEAAHRVMEMQSQRAHEAELQNMRQSVTSRARKLELERKMQEERWAEEDEQRLTQLRMAKKQREDEARALEVLATNRDLETKALLSELQLETEKQRLLRERGLRKLTEEMQLKAENDVKAKRAFAKLIDEEEQREKETLVREQIGWLNEQRKQRELLLEEEIKRANMDAETSKLRLQELQSRKRQRDFEANVLNQQQEELQRQLDEEKTVQQKLAELERQRLSDKAVEAQLQMKLEETTIKSEFSSYLRQQTSEQIEQERLAYKMKRIAEREAMEKKYAEELARRGGENHEAQPPISSGTGLDSVSEDVGDESPSTLAARARDLLERHKEKRREMRRLIEQSDESEEDL